MKKGLIVAIPVPAKKVTMAPSNGPLNKDESVVLQSLLTRHIASSSSDVIIIPSKRGRKRRLIELPSPTVSSSHAAERTLKRRCHLITTVLTSITAQPTASAIVKRDSLTVQLAQWMRSKAHQTILLYAKIK